MFFKLKESAEIRARSKKIRASLLRVASSWCNDTALADDLVQEALTLALKKQHQLRELDKFESWMFSILNNCWRGHLRKLKETVDIDDLTPAQAAELAESPSEDLRDMRAAILQLDDDYREPLVLQVLMGYSTKEIGEMMGLTQGAVLTRLHRARNKLMDSMTDE